MNLRTRWALSALVLSALASAVYAAGAAEQWLKSYQSEQSSDKRREMLESLPLKTSSAAKAFLLANIDEDKGKHTWYVRQGAISAFAKVDPDNKKVFKTIEKLLKKPKAKTQRLRATIIAAMGESKKKDFHSQILKAIDDPSAAVRRSASFALMQIRDPKNIKALMDRVKDYHDGKKPRSKKIEADGYRELVAYTRALSNLTGEKHARDTKKWTEWWAACKGKAKLAENITAADRQALAKEQKKEDSESRLKTVERGVTLEYNTKGRGKIKLLVLHDDAWSGGYFEPWLEPLHELCEIIYIKLPELKDFDAKKIKLKRNGALAYMPVDNLVDAFEAIRKERKFERFALLSHGFSALVAARYVTRHSDHVSHLIYVGGLTGDDAFGKILSNMEKVANNVWKDKEMRHMIDNHYVTDLQSGKTEYEPKDEAEALALQRKAFNVSFADPADPYLGELFEICRKPVILDLEKRKESVYLSPDFDISRERKPDKLPALVIVGRKSLWTDVTDSERLARNYALGKTVVFENSGMFPFVEENEKFIKTLKDFFDKHAPKEKKKK